MSSLKNLESLEIPEGGDGKFLCLTILGYKKAGMTEEAYRHHMTRVSAPMTKDLMVKYGIVRWTQVSQYALVLCTHRHGCICWYTTRAKTWTPLE
jgi:hypothetical protein